MDIYIYISIKKRIFIPYRSFYITFPSACLDRALYEKFTYTSKKKM